MKKIIFGMIFLAFVLILFGCTTSEGNYDAFAKCLTEKGAVMYGTESCIHCKNQKALFGNSFQYIEFFDCKENREGCRAKEVYTYPTWIIDGKQYNGKKELSFLAEVSGCEL